MDCLQQAQKTTAFLNSPTSPAPSERKVSSVSSSSINMSTSTGELPPSLTFHPFLRLPLELRLLVWTLAQPSPEIITHQLNRALKSAYPNRLNGIPAVLHACKESRYEFLEIETSDPVLQAKNEARRRQHALYRLCSLDPYPPTQGKATFISFEHDTIYRSQYYPTFSPYITYKHLVQNLIVVQEFGTHEFTKDVVYKFGTIYPELRKVTILVKAPKPLTARHLAYIAGERASGRWKEPLNPGTGGTSMSAKEVETAWNNHEFDYLRGLQDFLKLSPSTDMSFPGKNFFEVEWRVDNNFAEELGRQGWSLFGRPVGRIGELKVDVGVDLK